MNVVIGLGLSVAAESQQSANRPTDSYSGQPAQLSDGF